MFFHLEVATTELQEAELPVVWCYRGSTTTASLLPPLATPDWRERGETTALGLRHLVQKT